MIKKIIPIILILYKPDSMNHNDNNDDKKSSNNKAPQAPGGEFQRPDNFGEQNDRRIPWQKNMEQNNSQTPKSDVNIPDNNASAQPVAPSASQTDAADKENSNNKGGFPGGGMPDGGGMRMGRGGGPGSMGNGGNLNYTDDNLDSYTTIWDGQVNDSSDTDHKRVIEALKNVHGGTNIEKYINVNQVLKYMAVHNFSVNDDSLSGGMAHNYYLYEANGQISIIPWDYNLALGGMNGGDAASVVNEPIDASWQSTQLFDFVLKNEEYKACYHEYYERLVNEYLYGGKFEEAYNRIRTQIDELVETDPNSMYTYEEYIKGTETFYEVVMLRAESLKGQLDGTIPSTAEGQKADSSLLVDASHISISDMGKFMGGGGPDGDRPDFGNKGGGGKQMPEMTEEEKKDA